MSFSCLHVQIRFCAMVKIQRMWLKANLVIRPTYYFKKVEEIIDFNGMLLLLVFLKSGKEKFPAILKMKYICISIGTK